MLEAVPTVGAHRGPLQQPAEVARLLGDSGTVRQEEQGLGARPALEEPLDQQHLRHQRLPTRCGRSVGQVRLCGGVAAWGGGAPVRMRARRGPTLPAPKAAAPKFGGR